MECRRNAGPPDERITESTDALAHSACSRRPCDNAGVIPDGALHDRPLIPRGGIGMCGVQPAVVAQHVLLVMQQPEENIIFAAIGKRQIG